MNEIRIKKSVKKKWLEVTFFVLLCVVISDNVFAQKKWTKEYVNVVWDAKSKCIVMTIEVYDYSFGPKLEHGFLERCTFEASNDDKIYFKFMEIFTQKQIKSNYTTLYLKNKLFGANMEFLYTFLNPRNGSKWPDNSNLIVIVYNLSELGIVALGWHMDKLNRNVLFIRISGKWHVEGSCGVMFFHNIRYKINRPSLSMIKSNTTEIYTIVSKNDPVNVLKESGAIVIKGADLGAKIKVYTTSGVEIKSVISNNDVVKIKVPTKQIYLVHIGKSRYKVSL